MGQGDQGAVGLANQIVVGECLSAQLEGIARLQRQRVLPAFPVHQMDAVAIGQDSHSAILGGVGRGVKPA